MVLAPPGWSPDPQPGPHGELLAWGEGKAPASSLTLCWGELTAAWLLQERGLGFCPLPCHSLEWPVAEGPSVLAGVSQGFSLGTECTGIRYIPLPAPHFDILEALWLQS